jgi:hypothetical protein
MAQHFHSAAQREQAHRIFDLVRGFNVQNIGTEAHERFLEEFYWELNMFTNLHSATLEARATLGVEGQAAVEEEARQVHAAFLEEVAQTTDTQHLRTQPSQQLFLGNPDPLPCSL